MGLAVTWRLHCISVSHYAQSCSLHSPQLLIPTVLPSNPPIWKSPSQSKLLKDSNLQFILSINLPSYFKKKESSCSNSNFRSCTGQNNLFHMMAFQIFEDSYYVSWGEHPILGVCEKAEEPADAMRLKPGKCSVLETMHASELPSTARSISTHKTHWFHRQVLIINLENALP